MFFSPTHRHWALVIPIWILGLIPFITLMFIGHNLFRTPAFDSLCTLTGILVTNVSLNCVSKPRNKTDNKDTDEYANPMLPSDFHKFTRESVPDLQDVPIAVINECMFRKGRERRKGRGHVD